MNIHTFTYTDIYIHLYADTHTCTTACIHDKDLSPQGWQINCSGVKSWIIKMNGRTEKNNTFLPKTAPRVSVTTGTPHMLLTYVDNDLVNTRVAKEPAKCCNYHAWPQSGRWLKTRHKIEWRAHDTQNKRMPTRSSASDKQTRRVPISSCISPHASSYACAHLFLFQTTPAIFWLFLHASSHALEQSFSVIFVSHSKVLQQVRLG